MFKTEYYTSWPESQNWAEAIKSIHLRVCEEFRLVQSTDRLREWDLTYQITKSPVERYTCDTHDEFIQTLTSVPYFERFGWHNAYHDPKPKGLRGILTVISGERFGVGVDFSKREVEVSTHSSNLAFVERAQTIVRDELDLRRPEKIDADPYRRKMLEPRVFVARHFDDAGNAYYSNLSSFLTLIGFSVVQGEEYTSDSIPDKIKRRIDDQSILIANVSGDRDHSWLVSETSYALGKGKHIIILVESTTEFDPCLLGKDLEYLSYPVNCIERAYCSLLREFRSIGVKGLFY